MFEARAEGQVLHRYCEVQQIRQRSTGDFGATLFWPSRDGSLPPTIESTREDSRSPLTLSVGDERWTFAVELDGTQNVLVVTRP